jgi:drug/metabolite transporter (DMT)-like permease
MGLLYAGTLIVGVVFISMAEVIASEDPDMSAHEAQIFGGLFALISLPLCVFYFAAPLLPKTRFAWIYGIVAIAIGMTSACCLPAAIPLFIFWIKSDTKAFFQIA